MLFAIALVLAPVAAASTPFRATEFVTRVDNPWFPLTPGTVYVYRGIKGGKSSRDVVTVTHATRTIEGVKATSVHDDLYVEGRLEERTTDWYAQDTAGNVWYFGETTAELNLLLAPLAVDKREHFRSAMAQIIAACGTGPW